MSFIEPNFKVNNAETSHIITPMFNTDTFDVDKVLIGESMGDTETPIVQSESIERDKVVLATLDKGKTLYLYSDGSIKIGR